MFGSGLRPGEVYNLTTDRIDLNNRRVYVENRTATDDIPPFTVKAHDRSDDGKERTVPIPAATILDLTEAVRLAFESGGFVVLSPERYAYVREAWRKCRKGNPGAATRGIAPGRTATC
jgi:integrase